MNLTRPDNGEAIERLTAKLDALGVDEAGVYFLLCMSVLAKNAPDVAMFVMDRVDRHLEQAESAAGP